MKYDWDLGVWQNNHCIRCGGCCYVCAIYDLPEEKPRDQKCRYLQVDKEKSITYCSLHGSENKPESCKNYFCGKSDRVHFSMSHLERTLVTGAVLNVLKINPTPNCQEIKEFLDNFKPNPC